MRCPLLLGLLCAAAACGDDSEALREDAAPAPVIASVHVDQAGIEVESVPDPRAEAIALGWGVPLQGRITTPFGERPDGSAHDAIDIAAPMGTAVRAPADLVVRTIAYQTRAGRYVTADVQRADGSFSGPGYRLTFAHLSHVDAVEGQRVAAGTMLGLVGLSGTASGPHLHLRVEQVTSTGEVTARTAIDPLTVFSEADITGTPLE